MVHRGDGSGTTEIFIDYLSKVSPEWQHKVGQGATVIWPTGITAKRSDGVAELIKRTPGTISTWSLPMQCKWRSRMPGCRTERGAYCANIGQRQCGCNGNHHGAAERF